jgi:large repetitive protein
MKVFFYRKLMVFALILMTFQAFFPLVNAFATSNALPPSDVAVQYITPDDVKLTWSAVYGATGYNVYEILDGQLLLRDKTTSTSYNLNNMAEGSYRYVVSTVSSIGESGPSAPVSVEVVYPVMATPDVPVYTISNGNDLNLSWGTVQYAEKYNLYQISEDGKQTLIASPTGRSYKITNVPEGKYIYTVSSWNSLYGESALSEQVSISLDHPVMEAPNDLTYSLSNGTDITLKWSSVSYATKYNLYEITDNTRTLKSTLTGTSTKLSGLSSGEYMFEIRSYSDRFGESADGRQLKVTIGDVVMSAPEHLTYKLQNINDIVFSWDSVYDATSYKIYQYVDGEKILKSSVSGTTYTVTNAPEGEHTYEIHSFSSVYGESENGSKLAVPVVHPTVMPPNYMTGTVKDDKDITLTWDMEELATNYRVYQMVDGKKVLKNTITGTSVTYYNLTPGEYTYVVHSYSSRFGESLEGSQLTIMVNGKTMYPPTNLTYTVNNGNDVKLNWTAAENATNYKIYQVIDGVKFLKSTITGTTITYTNLPEGDYQFVIHSNSSIFGESKNGVEVKFPLVHPTMEAPVDVTYKISNGNDLVLNWTAAEYATAYKLYELIDGVKVLRYSGSEFGTTISKLTAGEHSYVIHSYSSRFGESAEGKEITVTINEYTMDAPANLTYTVTNINTLSLKWDASLYANRYKLYEIIDGERILKSTVSGTAATISNIAEGEHRYQVHSHSDRFGESPEGTPVTIDIVFPEIKAPQNMSYNIQNGNDIVLKWEAANYATSYKVYEYIDGQLYWKTTVTSLSAVIPNISEGSHTYFVYTVSSRFGESANGSIQSVEVIYPTMEAPQNLTNTFVNGNDITLRWIGATYANSYKVYQIIDGEKVLKTTVSGTSAVFANMPEGNYEFEIHSFSSRFGESQVGTDISFDLIFPIMQAPENITYTITNGNDITLKWNGAAYATSYKVYRVVDGQKELVSTVTKTAVSFLNIPEGDYLYEVHSYSSRFGESPKSNIIELTLVWPVVQPPQITGTVFNINNITLSWPAVTWANEYRIYKITNNNKELIYNGKALSYKAYNLSEQTHTFEVTAYSTRFGESILSNQVTETIIYPIMGVPEPSLALLGETSARISWDFVTYANGYNIYELIDGKPVLVAGQVNNLSYTVTDLTYANHEYFVTSYSNSFGESNPSEIVLAKLIVDTEAPVTSSNISTAWKKDSVNVELTASDNETGIAATYYSLNGGSFAEGTTLTVSGEGIYQVAYYSVDKAGNKEEVKTETVKIDSQAPFTESNIEENWQSGGFTVKLVSEDLLSGVSQVYYSINGGEFKEGTTVNIPANGIYEVSYYSIDIAGNKEVVRTEILKIDNFAPATSTNIIGKWYKNGLNVKFSANDDFSGVASTYYSVNGLEFIKGDEVLLEVEGVYEVSFYSIDKAGNREAVNNQTVKVDNTKPVTYDNTSNLWYNSNVNVVLSANDNLSGVVETFYSVNGSEFVAGTNFEVTEEGINEITYYSVDAVGNIEDQKSTHVRIDKTAPTVIANLDEEYVLGSDFLISYIAKDKHSGVAFEEVSVNGIAYNNGEAILLDQPGIYTLNVKVTDHAGWTTTYEKEFVVYIPIMLEVIPNAIKGNKGIFTVKANLPEEFAGASFNISTVTLNGVTPVINLNGLAKQAEKGHFKFEREDFDWVPGKVKLEFRGYLDNGYLVTGSKIVDVK